MRTSSATVAGQVVEDGGEPGPTPVRTEDQRRGHEVAGRVVEVVREGTQG
jgi:hypothetical protein